MIQFDKYLWIGLQPPTSFPLLTNVTSIMNMIDVGSEFNNPQICEALWGIIDSLEICCFATNG